MITKEDMQQWYAHYTQYANGWHLSEDDLRELRRLNHLIMEASHRIHNDHMLEWRAV